MYGVESITVVLGRMCCKIRVPSNRHPYHGIKLNGVRNYDPWPSVHKINSSSVLPNKYTTGSYWLRWSPSPLSVGVDAENISFMCRDGHNLVGLY